MYFQFHFRARQVLKLKQLQECKEEGYKKIGFTALKLPDKVFSRFLSVPLNLEQACNALAHTVLRVSIR